MRYLKTTTTLNALRSDLRRAPDDRFKIALYAEARDYLVEAEIDHAAQFGFKLNDAEYLRRTRAIRQCELAIDFILESHGADPA